MPPTPSPAGNGDADDYLTLPFVERLLMEEDIDDDKFLYGQCPDYHHPALLQAQEPYAQILSDAATTDESTASSEHEQLGNPNASSDEEETTTKKKNNDAVVAVDGGEHAFVSRAFLKGMEEANKFLPTNNKTLLLEPLPLPLVMEEENDGSSGGDCRGRGRCRKSRDQDAETMVGSRKSKMMAPEPVERGEVVDEMIANGFQLFLQELSSLRITMGGKKKKKAAGTGSSSNETTRVDLQALLLQCAQAVAADNRRSAAELLAHIRQHSSPWGDATQRLAHCFAEGLEARLAGSGSPAYASLMARRTRTPTPVVDLLRAQRLYAAACCFRVMAFKFANMTICKAVAGARGRKKKKKSTSKLHIVDYGVQYGSQWPGLLKLLSMWPGGPPEVRLTGIDAPQPGFRPAARVQDTGRRLNAYARRLGVPFRFRAVAANWESVTAADLDTDPDDDEVLVVNSVLQFESLTMDEGVDATTPSPRDLVLANVRAIRPDVFVLSVSNGAYSSPYFLPRFREAMLHYAAMFDMLDATAPRDSELRVLVERELFGQGAQNAIACEGADRVERPQTYRQWQARNLRAGLRQLPLHTDVVEAVRESVREGFHQDIVTDVDQQWLLGGWKGRILYAMSTWAADGDGPVCL
ncbi:hypothetical protein U9M48_000227 [Paspalum notatum var. saurae]|uniref:Uncharacterized protein n=1 Tax=Paspalum notatum var. saurae TaxID=547442 RepID=A0AAQ3PDV4_PASNO